MLDVSSVGSGPLPLEAALDALEASKLSKSDQASLVEHVAATLDLLRRADLAPEGDVRADAQAVRKAVEQLLDEKAQNAKSNSALKACNSLIAATSCGTMVIALLRSMGIAPIAERIDPSGLQKSVSLARKLTSTSTTSL